MATTPGTHDITAYRGDSLRVALEFVGGTPEAPIALPATGWRAQIRRYATDAEQAGAFTLELDGVAEGTIVLVLTAAQTAALPSGVWDLESTVGADVRTYLRGRIVFVEDVSR